MKAKHLWDGIVQTTERYTNQEHPSTWIPMSLFMPCGDTNVTDVTVQEVLHLHIRARHALVPEKPLIQRINM